MNSYLNDNLEDKQFFILDPFSSKAIPLSFLFFRLASKLRYILGMCYTLVLPETQVLSYLNIVLKHTYGLA